MVRLGLEQRCARVRSMMDQVRAVLGRPGPILLDFDGPVCSIFARCSAPNIAVKLCLALVSGGVSLPEDVAVEPDPLEVLRWTGRHQSDLTETVEAVLCKAELQAADTAEPTTGAMETVVAAWHTGRPIVIVSNNSAPAIRSYLLRQRLDSKIAAVVGRPYAQPHLMKPNPAPIIAALNLIGAESKTGVLIGDSVTDIEGAKAAGVAAIGYANKPSKEALFRWAAADAVITNMADIAHAIIAGTASA